MRLLACLVIACCMLTVGAARAQVFLRGDVPHSAALGTASERLPGGVLYDCYMLHTTPGSVWEVDVRSNFTREIHLVDAEQCDDTTGRHWIAGVGQTFGGGKLRFTAGGGTYSIFVRGWRYDSYSGPYVITARLVGRSGGRMVRAGADILHPDVPTDTASTVADEPPQSQAGEIFRDCDTCPSMVVVGPGSFMMGSPAEEAGRHATEGPRHVVTLNRAFAVGQYEVTFDEYDACVAERGCAALQDNSWGRGRRPAINATFYDALRYTDWLSRKTGQRYFLPSEAEWEYVARAGSDTPWNSGSAIITDDANILNQFARTVPVGAYPPNAFGLYDVHGNVSEWTLDCIDTGYVGVPVNGSAWMAGNCHEQTVVRGGNYQSEPIYVRSASRGYSGRSTRWARVGFRVTRALGADVASAPSNASPPVLAAAPVTSSDGSTPAVRPSDPHATPARPLAVGSVQFAPTISTRIGCRGVSVDLARAGDLNEALSGLLEQSLRTRSLFDPAGTRMQLVVQSLSASTLGDGAWTVTIVASSERLPSGYAATITHPFRAHFAADIACRRAEEAFGGALTKAVEAVLDHPDLSRL